MWSPYAVHPGPVTWILVGALASAQRAPAEVAPEGVEAPPAVETPPAVESPPAAETPPAASAATEPATPTPADADATELDATKPPATAVPPPKPTAPPPRKLAPPTLSRGARVAYIVSGGVVLAGAGVALGFMGHYIAESKRLERDGRDRVGTSPVNVDGATLQDIVADGIRANHRAITLGVVGGLVASSGLALILIGARKPRVRGVTASVGRSGAGLVWTGRF